MKTEDPPQHHQMILSGEGAGSEHVTIAPVHSLGGVAPNFTFFPPYIPGMKPCCNAGFSLTSQRVSVVGDKDAGLHLQKEPTQQEILGGNRIM